MNSIISFLLFLPLLGCTDSNTNENIDEQTPQEENKSIFMSDAEIQNLISSKSTFFMGYWSGMSKKEVIEVTRYLLNREEISGIVYDPDDDSSYQNRCIDFSLDFDNKCGYRDLYKNNFYLLKGDQANKLTVLIGGTRLEIEFHYSYLNNQNLLSSIVLSALSEQTTASRVDYENFQKISELYQEKYGIPSQKYFDAPKKGSLTYNYGDIEIQIYYNSSESIPTFGMGYAPNQIRIEYMDKDLTNRVKSKYQSEKKQQEIDNQRIRDSLDKANKNNSLRRI